MDNILTPLSPASKVGWRAAHGASVEPHVDVKPLRRRCSNSQSEDGDVTLGHYVGKSEAQLRAGWQTVADFVEALSPTAQVSARTQTRVG